MVARSVLYVMTFLHYPKQEFTATEFAYETRIPIACVYRLFRLLETLGWVERMGRSRERILTVRGIPPPLQYPFNFNTGRYVWRKLITVRYTATGKSIEVPFRELS